MEHINENTIRVVIENSDLERRGITFLDLLGNQKHIENFFYSILEEVDVEEEFQESDAVTFQVMPNKNGLELYISKGSNLRDDILDSHDNQVDFGLSDLDELYQNKYRQYKNGSSNNEEETDEAYVLAFESFEDVIMLSDKYDIGYKGTTLYQYKDYYYIVFNQTQPDEGLGLYTAEEERAIALEYGEKSSVSESVLAEHGNVVVENKALETIHYYFGKDFH